MRKSMNVVYFCSVLLRGVKKIRVRKGNTLKEQCGEMFLFSPQKPFVDAS